MPECFTIMSNEIEGRLDPFYYRPEFREFDKRLSKIKVVSFGQIIKNITNGFDYRKYTGEGLIYLRVSNIKPFEFDLTDIKKINPPFKINKNIKLKKGDLLLTRKGTYGIALALDKDYDYVISSEIFRIKLTKEVNPKFIEIILNSNIGQKQFSKYKIGGIMGSLSQEAVKQIKIPLPPLSIQNRIVALMDQAYKLKKQKQSEAKKLLDSINDYVLFELGIKMPALKDQMTFVVHADDVKGKRIDPYYYQPKFEEIEKAIEQGKYELIKVNNLIATSSNKKIKIEDNKKYIYVEIGDINKTNTIVNLKKEELGEKLPKGPKKKLIKDDIIISTVRPYLKGVAKIRDNKENLISTSAFCVLRSKNNVNPDYLLGFVRSELFTNMVCRNMAGTTYPTVSERDILNLKIPFPPLEIQNKIAEEVKRRMQKAEQLQKEAEEILEKAKQEVEKIILEG